MENNRPLGWTTIDESKKLVETGLDPNTADMCYQIMGNNGDRTYVSSALTFSPEDDDIPCWSLSALLETLPCSIGKVDVMGTRKNYGLNLYRSYHHCCGYSFGPSLEKENHDVLCCYGESSWIEAVLDTVIWSLENGYIEKCNK